MNLPYITSKLVQVLWGYSYSHRFRRGVSVNPTYTGTLLMRPHPCLLHRSLADIKLSIPDGRAHTCTFCPSFSGIVQLCCLFFLYSNKQVICGKLFYKGCKKVDRILSMSVRKLCTHTHKVECKGSTTQDSRRCQFFVCWLVLCLKQSCQSNSKILLY